MTGRLPVPSAGQHLVAVVIASVGQHRDLLASACRAGLPAHGGQLRPIAADIGHVMGDDQMVLGIDGDLHIVADNASALAAGRHRAGIGIGQGDLFVGRGLDLLTNLPEGLHLPPQALDLLLGGIVLALAISPSSRSARSKTPR